MNAQVALYARVSSEQQAQAHTIESQLAELRARVAGEGLAVREEYVFIDEGYSGSVLNRPGLEQLRDLAAGGAIDRVFIHSPDRLARRYAYQVLLLEELERAGVRVVFLDHPDSRSPEAELLRQVQGMIAEYERAQILERSRRGKRHAAQIGAVSALTQAPYGYRYVSKNAGAGQAFFEVVLDEARVVRQIFDWVGRARLSLREVCRRLSRAGELTRSGTTDWTPTTIWGMLQNPAYVGRAAYGKTRAATPQAPLRPRRGQPAPARRNRGTEPVDPTEWISIPVPPLVSEEAFLAAQEQLEENRKRHRAQRRGARYLLQGLICCAQCGYAFYGKVARGRVGRGQVCHYGYYR